MTEGQMCQHPTAKTWVGSRWSSGPGKCPFTGRFQVGGLLVCTRHKKAVEARARRDVLLRQELRAMVVARFGPLGSGETSLKFDQLIDDLLRRIEKWRS